MRQAIRGLASRRRQGAASPAITDDPALQPHIEGLWQRDQELGAPPEIGAPAETFLS
jgi:hypothetical protein